jgi:PAS domain S-box-containing protein
VNSFFATQLDYIYFVYGLAFFTLFATMQSLKKLNDTQIQWFWLGIFGALHGTLEWLDLTAMNLGDSALFKQFRLLLMIVSFIPLLEFARVNLKIQISTIFYFPLFLILSWAFFELPLNEVNVLTRYTISLPGTIVGAIAIFAHSNESEHFRGQYRKIAVCLIAYGITSGVIVPQSGIFPSNIINTNVFLDFFGFPIQLLRAFFAVCIAYNSWILWRKVQIQHGSFFGIKPESNLDSVAVYAMLGVIILGWLSINWSVQSIGVANLTPAAIAEFRLSEIFQIALMTVLIAVFFVLIQNRATAKLHLDISSKMIESVFANSQNPMFVKHPDNQYLMANNAFCKLYGVEKNNLIGANDEVFKEQILYEVRKNDILNIANQKVTLEESFKAKDGELKIFTTNFSQISTLNGNIYVGTMLDITKLKNAIDELEHININLEHEVQDRLEELRQKDSMLIQQSKMVAMGEMISNIAHQWRQPLNTLGIKIQDLPVAFKFGEVNEEYVKQLNDESMNLIRYMSQTIDDFRNFFKPNKERLIFSVKDAITNATQIAKDTLNNSYIKISLNFCDEELKIDGYKNEFSQVILNILTNAKDALSLKDSEDRSIELSVFRIDNTIKITITDSGGGIDSSIIDKVFEPYFTTKHKAQGTGLGLYMSKMIIEHMGGKLYVNNTENGACFNIEFANSSCS